MPTFCMRAMRSLAGLEKPHSSMLQVATESLQPHWHCMRIPTRRTSALGFSEAVCARAATARMKANANFSFTGGINRPPALPVDGCMGIRNAHHLGARVLHFDLAGDQA